MPKSARSLSTLFALLMSAFAAGLPAAPAEEPAEDLAVSANAIESLTPEQARRLAADFPGATQAITVNGMKDGAINRHALPLNGLTALDAATARALAIHKGNLFLSTKKVLDLDAARALAKFKGPMLVIGLAHLDPDIVQAFGEYEGSLGGFEELVEQFVAMHPLSPENARGIASLMNGELGFLTALDSPDSVDIAKALATRKGWLALPNLKKISPKTITALIAKEDVDIPLIETLEFIREPDGSPTDDFFIPAGESTGTSE